MAQYHVSVDTGGTFSDFVLFSADSGALRVLKVPSTPHDPGEAVLTGLEQLKAEGLDLGEVTFFSHGTTVGTNALLQHRGARTGLLVTAGFRGIQEVGEQTRPYGLGTYSLGFQRPEPLVPAERTAEIRERVDHTGHVITPLDEQETRRSIQALLDAGVEAIAVCFLFSYVRPGHELRVAEIIRELAPDCKVSLSAEVLPQLREYYRMSTTVVNAFCSTVVSDYLLSMSDRLDDRGLATRQRYVMQSNGGVTTFAHAAQNSVVTLLSGPAGGVKAGVMTGAAAGFERVITFDMGGTSCDVALIEAGEPVQSTRAKLGGHDIAVPMIDMTAVGAGGGTLARVDAVKGLLVGPESAGAVPGPVAYGRGGQLPTVTDANLVLGYLNPDNFLGGQMQLDGAAAASAIEQHVAQPLGLSLQQAAAGIVEIVSARMSDAIKSVSTARGFDVREFALVAFGGAGPLHASSIARELGIPHVVIPPYPGVTSAVGLLMADVRRDFIRTEISKLDQLKPEHAQELVDDLCRQATDELSGEGFAPASISLSVAMDLRYEGQGYELTVPTGQPVTVESLATLRKDFDTLHRQLFGHAALDSPVDVVAYRVTATAQVPKIVPEQIRAEPTGLAPMQPRPCYFSEVGDAVECPVFRRSDLHVGQQVEGPLIVEQADTTLVVRPGQSVRADSLGNLIVATGV